MARSLIFLPISRTANPVLVFQDSANGGGSYVGVVVLLIRKLQAFPIDVMLIGCAIKSNLGVNLELETGECVSIGMGFLAVDSFSSVLNDVFRMELLRWTHRTGNAPSTRARANRREKN
jgi:hypothetical protein